MKQFIKNHQVMIIPEDWDEATIQTQVGDRLIIDGDPPNHNQGIEKLDLVEENGATVWKTVPLPEEEKKANLKRVFEEIDRDVNAHSFEFDGHNFPMDHDARLSWVDLKKIYSARSNHPIGEEEKFLIPTTDWLVNYNLLPERILAFLDAAYQERRILVNSSLRKKKFYKDDYLSPESAEPPVSDGGATDESESTDDPNSENGLNTDDTSESTGGQPE